MASSLVESRVEDVQVESSVLDVEQSETPPVVAPLPPKPARLVSLDAYRGFIMLAMASGGLGLAEVARQFPDSPVWQALGYQFSHVAWVGCGFWDLIQPSFMFMVGVAMPYSFASRKAKGDSFGRIYAHTIVRAIILVALGVFLSSNGSKQTNWTFANVLCQIGLGYAFVYLLIGRGFRVQLLALVGILAGYWLLFFLYPATPAGFVFPKIENRYVFHPFDGLAAHWNFITNAASGFDYWFLNLFPREKPFAHSEGGYATLSFIPSMATMIFGLMAGELLRGERPAGTKCKYLLLGGAACFVTALLLDHTIWPTWLADESVRSWTVCPSVKRIWTPTWAVFSTGWTLWMLGAFYWVIDLRGYQRWAFALVVVGMNSIAMYCMSQLMKGWVRYTLAVHLDVPWKWLTSLSWLSGFWDLLGVPPNQGIYQGVYGPIVGAVAPLLVLWLICLWLYRRKVFLRI